MCSEFLHVGWAKNSMSLHDTLQLALRALSSRGRGYIVSKNYILFSCLMHYIMDLILARVENGDIYKVEQIKISNSIFAMRLQIAII